MENATQYFGKHVVNVRDCGMMQHRQIQTLKILFKKIYMNTNILHKNRVLLSTNRILQFQISKLGSFKVSARLNLKIIQFLVETNHN